MSISSFTIHDKSEDDGKTLEYLYGTDMYRITKSDIVALLQGKILHTTENGEYAAIIELIDEDEPIIDEQTERECEA